MRRVELTALCAAVEHWQGRHEDAHRRLIARLGGPARPRHARGRGAPGRADRRRPLRERLRPDASRWASGALETARALGDRGLTAAAASVLALGEAAAARTARAREHRAEALEQIERMDDAELAHRLETLYYLGWAENYLEHYDDAIGHAERGVAIARATGRGTPARPADARCAATRSRCRGGSRRRSSCARQPSRSRGCPPTRTTCSGRCSSSAWARYFAGDLDGTIAARRGERSRGRPHARRARCRRPAAAPGWALAVAAFELGEVDKARRS